MKINVKINGTGMTPEVMAKALAGAMEQARIKSEDLARTISCPAHGRPPDIHLVAEEGNPGKWKYVGACCAEYGRELQKAMAEAGDGEVPLVEHDALAPKGKDASSGRWAIILAGLALLAGLAWWMARGK